MQKLLKVFFVQLILFYVCTFSRKIGRSVKLTHRDKLMIVNYHNDIRRLIYASNMQALSWDPAAAEKAREWGHNCIFNRLWDDNYGENLYKTYFTKATRSREVMMDALKDWDKERQNLFSWDVKCTESETCNYKQLVSAKSDSVGCALIKCPRMIESKKTTNYNMNYFICFYSPKVELDKQPFTYGRKCSACPQGYHCKRKMCTKKKWTKIKHSGNVINEKLPERKLNIPTANIIIREDSRGYIPNRNTSNDQTNVLLPIPPAALKGREASEKVFNGVNTELKITPRRRRRSSVTVEEQNYLTQAHNLLRGNQITALKWSRYLQRWADYVIRCVVEYPGPITTYTNFGQISNGGNIYNIVYNWGNEGYNVNRKLESGCRTPADRERCNHNVIVKNEFLREYACAARNCQNGKRQLTCIYR
ncbi:uncharacterized protein LOC127707777 isoform X3 [Mytilus californianus]|uniref:uncharacterized protein LOC127707777 isoform X3 n=1 Tax=Mytilus californianus TaxID=6549 RepID=UPI002245223A|nr:uncharacterized protein LOC127707777 isoform X3 [Mytilus californianus]